VLHLCLAKFGWLYRYESYLMALGVLAVGVAALRGHSPAGDLRASSVSHADLVLVGTVMAALAANGRTVGSLGVTASTAGHIFQQQRQMAAFIGRYYDADVVALNDIGAVSYFTRARVHDLKGLGSLEAATIVRAGRFAQTTSTSG
jgi:hypothetical protein